MSKTYTNEEVLERLKSLEGLLLERVFETSYSESLRTYDLIDHLRSKAHDLGLEGEGTYSALIRDLEKLSSTIGGLINGKRGELLAAKSLKMSSRRQPAAFQHCASEWRLVRGIRSSFNRPFGRIRDRGKELPKRCRDRRWRNPALRLSLLQRR